MLKKQNLIPFLLGWLVLGWVFPPQRLLSMKKTAG